MLDLTMKHLNLNIEIFVFYEENLLLYTDNNNEAKQFYFKLN